jgi:hypothetical protein
VWLDWHWAVGLAIGLGIAGIAARWSSISFVRSAGAFARETALVLALYAIWNYAGRLSLVHVNEAFSHGRWVWRTEHWLHLPSEVSFQKLLLPYPDVMRFLNAYYAVLHVPALLACLVWLFVTHRDKYPSLRTTLALTTGACLLVQLVPVAPPRMYPGYGFVDAGRVFGPTVYGKVGTGISDQLSAMPSVHVAWASLVALAVIMAGTSKWRYWILAHPFFTIVAVTATANHWWLDGIVAIAILFASFGLDHVTRAGIAKVRDRPPSDASAAPPPERDLAPDGVPTPV